MDVLTRMLRKATEQELIRGLGTYIIPRGVMSLQYANDTIIFLEKDTKRARNLKDILSYFQMMSGMRINYNKSEIVPLNLEDSDLLEISNIFGCPAGAFPIRYLGIPLHYQKLRREDLQPLVDKILKKLAGWRGKLLSYAGKLVRIKTCLASMPIYLLSFFKFPKWAINIINSHIARCMWNDYEGHGKIHLATWQIVSMKKLRRAWGPKLDRSQHGPVGVLGKTFSKR